MSKLNKFGELDDSSISQGDAELIALDDAERLVCTASSRVSSCFWVKSASFRDSYWDVVVEGHPNCADYVDSESIIRYRIRHDGSFRSSMQQRGHWNCPRCAKRSTCLIVTACFGVSSLEVDLARWYRDVVLRSTRQGRTVLDGYYKISPVIVSWMHRKHTFLLAVRHFLVRPLLEYGRSRLENRWTLRGIVSIPVAYTFIAVMWLAGIIKETG